MANPWRYPTPFIRRLTVARSDIDGLGHANNTAYIHWCEATAWAHSAQLGLTLADCQLIGKAMAITRAEYDYRVAARAGETLSVATWLTASDLKLTLERRFQIIRELDGRTLFSGRWQLVCINLASGQPARLPPEFLAVYGGNLVVCPPP